MKESLTELKLNAEDIEGADLGSTGRVQGKPLYVSCGSCPSVLKAFPIHDFSVLL